MRLIAFGVLLLAAILIPFLLWEADFARWAQELTSPAAIVVLLVLDVVLPVPSSLVATAAGAMFGFALGFVASWIGLTLGSAAGYLLGRLAHAFVRKRILGEADCARIARWMTRSSVWIVALSRPVPVLAEAVTLIAGVTRLPAKPFLALSALANAVVAAIYAGAGAMAYQSQSLTAAILAVLGLPLVSRAVVKRLTGSPASSPPAPGDPRK